MAKELTPKTTEDIRERFKSRHPFDTLEDANACIEILRIEIEEILQVIPKKYRVQMREGGGFEDPLSSLAVSLMKYKNAVNTESQLHMLEQFRVAYAKMPKKAYFVPAFLLYAELTEIFDDESSKNASGNTAKFLSWVQSTSKDPQHPHQKAASELLAILGTG